MKTLFVLPILLVSLLALSACGTSLADAVHDGDIIFHTSRSMQSIDVHKATHS